ncbi:MAG: L-histidine N(alpha)-methyltransferase [Deltaproteobacteria bacterium]|nr:L-histidine N(alpha)-methyltransferase [Deltaproteobacteria bacterium]
MASLSVARAGEQPNPEGSVDPTSRAAFRSAVIAGLDARPRALSSVWFYDAMGSLLFQRIMRLPGYYPTRVETEILEASSGEILGCLPVAPGAIVDLGAGDGAKTRLLLAAARRISPAVTYAPVDVAGEALRSATGRMRAVWPDLAVRAEQADYVEGLLRARRASGETPVLGLLLGSNVGNLEWAEAVSLLRSLRGSLAGGDHLLVGFDLLKDERVLRAAYDDPEGVTAAFNLNLLARINRELGGDLDLSAFSHRATFDLARPAMESWLVARRATVATIAGRRFRFASGEAIHTEISWKYTEAQLGALARAAGFEEVARWHDGRRWFCDALWRVGPEAR